MSDPSKLADATAAAVLRKPNRLKSRAASKAKFFCHRCDRAKVGHFGRCHVCGARSSTKVKHA